MDQVVIANGCSGALELALTALLDPGSVLLVPRPGFPLYQVIAESHGATVLHYNLLPEQGWECDLEHLEELMGMYERGIVRGIVVNNPSNPTGSVYSDEHLRRIVKFCGRHHLPIVADEIYGDMTFGSAQFFPLAQVAWRMGNHVPVITASGLGKQYLLPGWRVGWIVFCDNRSQALRHIEAGAKRLAQVILGASHLAQSIVPALLASQSKDMVNAINRWKNEVRHTLETQAKSLCSDLDVCHGLSVVVPQGAMYAMVQIDVSRFDEAIQSDVDFATLLLEEENVFVLPGSAFGVANVFRVVFCASEVTLSTASLRISEFCTRHGIYSE
jgi:tyrosine aminotransferase